MRINTLAGDLGELFALAAVIVLAMATLIGLSAVGHP